MVVVEAAVGREAPVDGTGGPVGRLYGANTVGGIFGAALGGFFLLPGLAVTGSVLLGVTANAAAANQGDYRLVALLAFPFDVTVAATGYDGPLSLEIFNDRGGAL